MPAAAAAAVVVVVVVVDACGADTNGLRFIAAVMVAAVVAAVALKPARNGDGEYGAFAYI